MKLAGAFLVVAAACGSDSKATIDAPVVEIDAQQIDAFVGTPVHYKYVVDKIRLPQSNAEARMYGLDLTGDDTVDNQLGMVIATLGMMGFDIQMTTDLAVDRGDAINLLDYETPSFGNAPLATFTMYVGDNPNPAPCNGTADTVCRRHLLGTGMFTKASAADTPLTGAVSMNTYAGGPGHLTVQLPVLGGASPVLVTLLGARTKVTGAQANLVTAAVIAGGVSQTDIDSKIIPMMQMSFQAIVAQSCTMTSNPPSCGCPSGSNAEQIISLFDKSPVDCAISVPEVKNNPLVMNLLAPDVMLEGQMAISLGVGITAVQAQF